MEPTVGLENLRNGFRWGNIAIISTQCYMKINIKGDMVVTKIFTHLFAVSSRQCSIMIGRM